MSEIKAGEVIGELQRMLKTFEALGRAQKVIGVLVEAEQREHALNTSITKLEQEELKLDSALDATFAELEQAKEEVTATKRTVQEKLDEADTKAKVILEQAKAEARLIVGAAQSTVDDMETTIKNATERKRKALLELAMEEDALNSFKAKAASEKARIKESFGV